MYKSRIVTQAYLKDWLSIIWLSNHYPQDCPHREQCVHKGAQQDSAHRTLQRWGEAQLDAKQMSWIERHLSCPRSFLFFCFSRWRWLTAACCSSSDSFLPVLLLFHILNCVFLQFLLLTCVVLLQHSSCSTFGGICFFLRKLLLTMLTYTSEELLCIKHEAELPAAEIWRGTRHGERAGAKVR